MKAEHLNMPKRRDMESALDVSRQFLLKLADNPKMFDSLPKRSVLLKIKRKEIPFEEIISIDDDLVLVELKEKQRRDVTRLKKIVTRLSSMIRNLEKRNLFSVKGRL